MTKDEALKLALEALELPSMKTQSMLEQRDVAIDAVKKALAQQALESKAENACELDLDYEPVGWSCLIAEADFSQNTVTLAMQCEDYKVSARQHWLSTIPPKREWVELTDEELMEMMGYEKQYGHIPQYARNFVEAISAKLKEKNNG